MVKIVSVAETNCRILQSELADGHVWDEPVEELTEQEQVALASMAAATAFVISATNQSKRIEL